MSQKFGSGFAGSSGLGPLKRMWLRFWLQCSSLKPWTLSGWLTHLALGRQPQRLTKRASPGGCLSILTTWLLASLKSEWSTSQKQRRKLQCHLWPSLRSYALSLLTHPIPWDKITKPRPYSGGEWLSSISWMEEYHRFVGMSETHHS